MKTGHEWMNIIEDIKKEVIRLNQHQTKPKFHKNNNNLIKYHLFYKQQTIASNMLNLIVLNLLNRISNSSQNLKYKLLSKK
jgi:hypothetical protein